MVLSLNATELQTQIASAIGDDFFAITSLIICLILGAFIGNWIGEKINH
jgi:preprotein translocase subunit SecY